MNAADPFVHPAALVETSDIGQGTRIWAFCHILKGARIGANCNIGDHCFIESKVVIGNNVVIKNGVSLWDEVTIEDDVFVGPNAVFTNDLWPRSRVYKERYTPTLIKRGASIGSNSTLICGIQIGQYAMIGAGSVVTKSVPDYALIYGVPGVLKGYVCKCTRKLSFGSDSVCQCPCGLEYRLIDQCVVLLIRA